MFSLAHRIATSLALCATMPILSLGVILICSAPEWHGRGHEIDLDRAIEALAAAPTARWQELLRDCDPWPTARGIALYTPRGELLATLPETEGTGREALQRFGRSHDPTALDVFRAGRLEIVEHPIAGTGGSAPPVPVGSVLVLVDPLLEKDDAERFQARLLPSALAVAALVVLCSLRLSRWIVRPLERLLAAVEALRAGDRSARVGDAGDHEVGRLAARFDRSVDEVQRVEDALECEQRRLEEAVSRRTNFLEQANRDLEQQDRLREEFLSSVSHELRTPLSGIRSAAEILRDYGDDAESRAEFQALLHRDMARLRFQFRNFRDLSRPPSPRSSHRPTSVRALVRRAVAECARSQPAERLRLRECGDDVPLSCDPARLQRAVEEVLHNALQFSNREVRIRVEGVDDRVEIEVRDEGIGIAESFHEAVFQRFRQLGSLLTEKPAGTGLGLSLCREAVHALGGTVEIRSRPGEGTTLRIEVPTAPVVAAERER